MRQGARPGILPTMYDDIPIWVDPPPRLPPPTLVPPVAIDADGLSGPTRGQSRGPHWRRTSPGLFVPTGTDSGEPAQRIIEASGYLPGGGGVTGWASLHLHGARYFDGENDSGSEQPVPLALPHHVRREQRDGIHPIRHRQAFTIVTRHGVPCVDVEAALFDEMVAREDNRERIAALEMVCFAELTSVLRFTTWLAARAGHPEINAVRAAVAEADEGVQSPQESAMLRVWRIDAGLPRPLCNRLLHSTNGTVLGRPDLLDPVAGVVGEYDGKHHRETGQRGKDVEREEKFRDHGLEYFSVVGGQLSNRTKVARRMQQARERALANPRPATWTLDWGSPPLTLDERIALRERRGEAQGPPLPTRPPSAYP